MLHGILEEMTFKDLQRRLKEVKAERSHWAQQKRLQIQREKEKENLELERLQKKLLKKREQKRRERERKKGERNRHQREAMQLKQKEDKRKQKEMKVKLARVKRERERERKALADIEKKMIKQREYMDLGKEQIEAKNNLNLQKGKQFKDRGDQIEWIRTKIQRDKVRDLRERNKCIERTQRAEEILMANTETWDKLEKTLAQTSKFLKNEQDAKRAHNLRQRRIQVEQQESILEELFEEEEGLIEDQYFFEQEKSRPEDELSPKMGRIDTLLDSNLKDINF